MGHFNPNEFLDLVYGAALEPSLWTPVMEHYADAIGGDKGWLSILDLNGGAAGGMLARIDPAELDRYTAHYADRNPLHLVEDPERWVKSWSPRILTDEDWMAKSELVATEYYNDFLKPQEIHSCIMVRLAVRGTETATINITRPKARGQFDSADLELARSVYPHLLRAFDLGRKLAADRAIESGVAAVFDTSPHGLFLTEADGRVRRMNAVGEALARKRRGVAVCAGRLTAVDPAASRALQGLMGRAASPDPAARSGGSMPLGVADSATPLSVTVAPMRAPDLGVLGPPPAVMVCVTDVEAGVRLPEQRLRDIFGLTPAEARLALVLFEGLSLREAAEALTVSPYTAQNQLARIFEKTGTNRQSVLVKLMMQVVGLELG